MQANDDVDPVDGCPLGRLGQVGNDDLVAGNVLKTARAWVEEMMVLADIGVEIRTRRIDDDLAHKTGGRELVQGVVNRCQRHPDTGAERFAVKHFCGYVTISPIKKKPREGQTLAGRTQTGGPQTIKNVAEWSHFPHSSYVGTDDCILNGSLVF